MMDRDITTLRERHIGLPKKMEGPTSYRRVKKQAPPLENRHHP
jgi:hypothetical protein